MRGSRDSPKQRHKTETVASVLHGFLANMPRPARKDVLGDGNCFVHLVYRCHNKDFLLQDDEVKLFLYNLLLKFKKAFQVKIFDYVFMDSHFHMLLYISSTEQLSAFMRRVFGSLAVFINQRMHRSGRVFGDRARTPVIQDKGYFLSTMFYIANNPVRAKMAIKAKDYKWSGYSHYAYGKPDTLIDDAPEYIALSNVAAIRRKEYQKLANLPLHRHEKQKPEYVGWYFIGDRDWILAMMVSRGFIRPKKPPG